MKNIKKIVMIIILAMTVVGCELLSSNYWDGVNERRRERGRTCYEDRYGNFYCVKNK